MGGRCGELDAYRADFDVAVRVGVAVELLMLPFERGRASAAAVWGTVSSVA